MINLETFLKDDNLIRTTQLSNYDNELYINLRKYINDPNFYIAFISCQNYCLYKKVRKAYPLFVIKFLDAISDIPIVRKYVNDIVSDDYINLDYNMLSLWDLVYKEEILLSDKLYLSQYIPSSKTRKTSLCGQFEKLTKYDPNSVAIICIFTCLCKIDYYTKTEEIELEDKLNNDLTPLHDLYKFTNYYDIVTFSSETKSIIVKYKHLFNKININTWTNNLFKYQNPIGECKNNNDKFFFYAYNSSIRGVVTYNILFWMLYYGLNILSDDVYILLLKTICTYIRNDNIVITPSIPFDLLRSNTDMIFNFVYKNDISYIIDDISDKILSYIHQNEESIEKYLNKKIFDFHYTDKIPMNDTLFKFMLLHSPLEFNKSTDVLLKYSIERTSLMTNNYDYKIYNSFKVLETIESNSIEIIDIHNNIKTVSISYIMNNEDIIDKKVIKNSILNMLYKNINFIPENKPDIINQISEYRCNIKNFNKLLNELTPCNLMPIVKNKIKTSMFLDSIFNNTLNE